MSTIAVFGLGAMGNGMASSILRAGHTTYGFDVVPAQMERFQSQGGATGTVAEVAGSLDAVAIVVLNAAQTEAVMFGGGGIVPQLKKGSVILACATVPPEFARAMEARCAEHGVLFLDAPISGGAAKAAVGPVTAASASWKVMARPWRTTRAPILISFSCRLVRDQSAMASGNSMQRRTMAKL